MVSYSPLSCPIKTVVSLSWCLLTGTGNSNKMKATSSLAYTCIKQAVLLCDVALLKLGFTLHFLLLPSFKSGVWCLAARVPPWPFSWHILAHWRGGFLGKVAFLLADLQRIWKIEPDSLWKYELSVIHVLCGETDWLEPISWLLFICVGSGTSPTTTIKLSLMK